MKKPKMGGFTLVEMLLVLSLLSIIILLSIPIHHEIVTKEDENRFMQILLFDILYVQNLAMTTSDPVILRFKNDHYVILRQTDQVLYKRTIPSNIIIQTNTLKQISFTSTGTIRKAGTMRFNASTRTFKLICPLGKGRCYSEKQ